MTVPKDLGVPVSQTVLTASKAVNAALVSIAALAGVVVTLISDGTLSGSDVGTLITAVLGAVTTVGTVFQTENKPKI